MGFQWESLAKKCPTLAARKVCNMVCSTETTAEVELTPSVIDILIFEEHFSHQPAMRVQR